LELGRIDLAVEIARPTDAELHQCQLLQDSLCVVAGPAFVGELDCERYLAAEHVAVTSRRRGICVEDLALGRLGLQRQVRQRCQHYLSAALLVQHSDWLLTSRDATPSCSMSDWAIACCRCRLSCRR